MSKALLPLVALFLASVLACGWPRGGVAPVATQQSAKDTAKPAAPGEAAEQRPDPRLPEEKLVKAFLVKHAPGGEASLAFLKWGPHELEGKSLAGFRDTEYDGCKIIRCTIHAANNRGGKTFRDNLLAIHKGAVVEAVWGNDAGDNWKARWRHSGDGQIKLPSNFAGSVEDFFIFM